MFSLITVCLELILPHAVPAAVGTFSSRIDQRSQTLWRLVFTPPRATKHGLAFAIGEPSFEVVFWPGFDMALCFLTWSSERKSLKWLQEYIEKLKWLMLNKWSRWFHSSRLKFPFVSMSASWFWVSFFFWFASRFPNLSCHTANQEQLCGFWTHVSSLDFVLWLSFWSRLHCPQKCTTETHLEKNVCLWVHNPHHSIAQSLSFCWHSGSWSWNEESHQFPGCHYGWVEQCCWLNVVLQSLCPKDQEQVAHPHVTQQAEKSQTL